MKNTWRRTIAFALIVCALLSVMVPGVSAVETPVVDNESETYNLAAGKTGNADRLFGTGTTDAASIAEKYAAGTLRWKFEIGSGYGTWGSVYVDINVGGSNRVAFRFKSPGNGIYAVKMNHYKRNAGSKEGAFWILPYAEYDLRGLNAAAPASTALGTMDCYMDAAGVIAGTSTTGYYEFEAGKEYLLVLGKTETTSTDKRIYPASLRVDKVSAAIGEDAYYTTMDAAIAAAKSGEEIDLLRDYETVSVDIPAGVTLDLNGKKLTADVIGQGKLTDSSAAAGVVISDKAPTCGVNADELLLKTTAGYQIFDYTLEASEVETAEDGKSVNFWFDVRFAEAQAAAAYTAIATGNSGFGLTVDLSWEDGAALPVRFGDGKSVQDWASLMLQKPEYSFYICVEGLDSVTTAGTLKAAPKIVGLQGSSTVEMTYDIAAQ